MFLHSSFSYKVYLYISLSTFLLVFFQYFFQQQQRSI
jgi:hypothetical protein